MRRLAYERLEVLSSRAGGHPVGAPATRDEERAMAAELLAMRHALAQARENITPIYLSTRGPVMHPNCRQHTIDMVNEAVNTAMAKRKIT